MAPAVSVPPIYPVYPTNTAANDLRRAAAMRSYITPAVITLVLYFVLWLPGLVANLVYYFAARHDERVSGVVPQGSGCITALLIFFIVLPVGGVAAIILLSLTGTLTSVLFAAANR